MMKVSSKEERRARLVEEMVGRQRQSEDSDCKSDSIMLVMKEEVRRLEAVINSGFAEVLMTVTERQDLDRFKEEQISRLHEELQEYKNDLVSRIYAPIIHSLIRLYDDLNKVIVNLHHVPKKELNPGRFFKVLEGFVDDIELLFDQYGVESFQIPGEHFDPHCQTSIKTIKTDNTDMVGKIGERLRYGFRHGSSILKKERVAVFVANTPRKSGPKDLAEEHEPKGEAR